MQRTPIKLSLFAQNNGGGEREGIGYLVLDLRTAGTKQHTGKWLPILSNKYTKFKCEMNVQLGLEEQSQGLHQGLSNRTILPKVGLKGQFCFFRVSLTGQLVNLSKLSVLFM